MVKGKSGKKKFVNLYFVFMDKCRGEFTKKHRDIKLEAIIGKGRGERWKSKTKDKKATYMP